ncbi:hypothetical protein GCM10018785_15990 [Streptomyces longispororuber]|uniref:HTH araC/xylS-type domain-containing protein n=1 Tax=Streptomyces longispororuber TaxID=68230 RepID=A0A918ZEF0_9ACTN|nr:helix-turn-helix transcriptional regulator [Streptomyces longispororuber]GHE47139.1 hypothetical protein GCM10018785_15990 [Streptomyces longispororuber]
MEAFDFDSDSLELTEEFLSRVYTRMHLRSDTEHTRIHVTRDVLGQLALDRLDVTYGMAHQAEPIGKILVCSVHSGGIVRQYFPNGDEGTFGPGDLFLYTPHNRSYEGVIHHARYDILTLEPDILSKVAAASPGRTPDRVRLTDDKPVSPAAGRHLKRAMSYLLQSVRGRSDTPQHDLFASTACQYVAAGVLNTFPSNALTDPTIEDRHDAHPATLRRAVAFIDEHAHTDISVADIAAAVSVSIRTLQLAFRRHMNTTPMSYLRRTRLAHAHADLMAADATTGVTVAAVATRWGFHQPYRFTRTYHAAYGRTPQQTLRDHHA